MNSEQQSAIILLRKRIEAAVDCKMRTPKDFNFLSECIFGKLHKNISATTLKRIWGYVDAGDTMPRTATLDLLAQFVDHADWEAFCQQHGQQPTAHNNILPPPIPIPHRRKLATAAGVN